MPRLVVVVVSAEILSAKKNSSSSNDNDDLQREFPPQFVAVLSYCQAMDIPVGFVTQPPFRPYLERLQQRRGLPNNPNQFILDLLTSESEFMRACLRKEGKGGAELLRSGINFSIKMLAEIVTNSDQAKEDESRLVDLEDICVIVDPQLTAIGNSNIAEAAKSYGCEVIRVEPAFALKHVVALAKITGLNMRHMGKMKFDSATPDGQATLSYIASMQSVRGHQYGRSVSREIDRLNIQAAAEELSRHAKWANVGAGMFFLPVFFVLAHVAIDLYQASMDGEKISEDAHETISHLSLIMASLVARAAVYAFYQRRRQPDSYITADKANRSISTTVIFIFWLLFSYMVADGSQYKFPQDSVESDAIILAVVVPLYACSQIFLNYLRTFPPLERPNMNRVHLMLANLIGNFGGVAIGDGFIVFQGIAPDTSAYRKTTSFFGGLGAPVVVYCYRILVQEDMSKARNLGAILQSIAVMALTMSSAFFLTPIAAASTQQRQGSDTYLLLIGTFAVLGNLLGQTFFESVEKAKKCCKSDATNRNRFYRPADQQYLIGRAGENDSLLTASSSLNYRGT